MNCSEQISNLNKSQHNEKNFSNLPVGHYGLHSHIRMQNKTRRMDFALQWKRPDWLEAKNFGLCVE
jgi:hypothetical protein